MAEEAVTQEAQAQTEAEKAPAGRTYSQADLDAITEKVKKAERERVAAEYKRQQDEQSMSELEKIKRAAAENEKALSEMKARADKASRVNDLLRKVNPTAYVPPLYLEHVADKWDQDEWDAEGAFDRARKLWQEQSQQVTTEPEKRTNATARMGTPAVGEHDFSNMTSAQIKLKAAQMPRAEAVKFMSNVQSFRQGGGKLSDE